MQESLQSSILHLGIQLGKMDDKAIEESFMDGEFDPSPKQVTETPSD